MLTPEVAARLAHRHYGIRCTAHRLDGEHDLNFRLDDGGRGFILKCHRHHDDAGVLQFQDRILEWLTEQARLPGAPGVIVSRDGACQVSVELDGEHFTLRCLTWLDGVLWARTSVDPLEGPFSLGGYLARLHRSLTGFSHACAERDSPWDMRRAERHLDGLASIESDGLRARVEGILTRFREHVHDRLARLPNHVIHNDANDHNIVMDADGKVAGLIDYGDAILGHRVTDIAVACAYAMCGSADPFSVASRIVTGYHVDQPLDEAEIELIPDLIETRIAMSVSMSAQLRREQPDNDYLLVSQQPFQELLERLEHENRELAHYRLRDACGLSPDPRSPRIVQFLRTRRSGFANICSHDLADPAKVLMLDLSSHGKHAAAMRDMHDTRAFTDYIFGLMHEQGAEVGIGRYLEKRGVYQTEAYETANPAERRDRHLGVDLFLPAGEAIHAPIEGIVEVVADNANPQDFGPTVILRHRTDDDTPFWTLYGHLSRETLAQVAPGQTVSASECIGWVGDFPINGDWPAHLHFQVMTSLLGMGAGIHGVGNDAMLEVWESVFPNPELVIRTPFPLRAPVVRDAEHLRLRRRINLGRMLGLSYREPLKITSGAGQYLFDEAGNRYLDLVNNVCHVGHCHPRVVAAGCTQMAVLNTNTRYLHDHIVELARRLSAMLPDPLAVCFFVNSGSEANDLALRLARAHTGRRDMLVLEEAYHGHLSGTIDVSPYKFDGAGGSGPPAHAHVCELPNTYRGRYRRDDPDAGAKYALSVKTCIESLQAGGIRPAAFIAESLGGVSGQMILPDGYLDEVYRYVREAGGVCIADEVQVGLGRMGHCMWGFETQQVVPDIVTIGKPLGNGHPVAAVVTTAAIANSFNNGMEYFNTFGGNPVSCAIALAVLDAIQTDGLMENATARGRQLIDGLAGLRQRHSLIGDVRGIGLFVGVELVRDHETLEPATSEARALVEFVKSQGILVSTDGHYDNVLKIKPPMCIEADDIHRFLAVLETGFRTPGVCRTQD